jgi:hypothetical protein
LSKLIYFAKRSKNRGPKMLFLNIRGHNRKFLRLRGPKVLL